MKFLIGLTSFVIIILLYSIVADVHANEYYQLPDKQVARNWENAKKLSKQVWEDEYDLYGSYRIKTIKNPHVDHVLPASWMYKSLACSMGTQDRSNCGTVDAYQLFETDLRNLMPTTGALNIAKSDHPFCDPKVIKRTVRMYKEFKVVITDPIDTPNGMVTKCVIPPNHSKGRLARMQLRVADAYQITLPPAYRKLLESWCVMYPPDQVEQEWVSRVHDILNPPF